MFGLFKDRPRKYYRAKVIQEARERKITCKSANLGYMTVALDMYGEAYGVAASFLNDDIREKLKEI